MDFPVPLSHRLQQTSREAMLDGCPAHIQMPLELLLQKHLPAVDKTIPGTTGLIAAHLRADLSDTPFTEVPWALLSWAKDDPHHRYLDLAESLLSAATLAYAAALELLLRTGGSRWMVREKAIQFTERVDKTAQQTYERATEPEDEASGHLHTAWVAAYGRNPDPSDAWDHAIKAVEAILVPLVLAPGVRSRTLGKVVAALRDDNSKVALNLQDNAENPDSRTNPADALYRLLRLIWVNPDRHAGGFVRPPSLVEAQGVLQAAVLVVQWSRIGVLRASAP